MVLIIITTISTGQGDIDSANSTHRSRSSGVPVLNRCMNAKMVKNLSMIWKVTVYII